MNLLLVLLTIALAVLCLVLFIDRRKSSREVSLLRTEHQELRAENEALGVFRTIRDAESEAQRIRREAKAQADVILAGAHQAQEKTESDIKAQLARASRESQEALTKATEEASRLRGQANQLLKEARDRVESMLRSAQTEAQGIVDTAHKKAQEVAGSAFDAVQNAERFEQIAKAMKNIIEGYGDQYVIPSHSLLDDLAKEYGFSEAGTELKNARERSRQMVKSSTAATCDYVEANRRETAIRFVVDAFNGKIDSILSRVKDDNVGTLQQEIRDAFSLVNHNGAAFRNARILNAYLEARLTELRWAATVQELKLRDREEQRRIKEQIREEERALREFERSMREAAKEEETLRKAMEKVQGQVEKANETQRQKYEAQLAELADKLRQAEEKNQRAKSMAEQTRMGHVYVISNIGSFGEDMVKIGLTRRLEPLDRIRELGDASVPFGFDVHAMIFHDDAPALERSLHKHFLTSQVNKVNPRKEFFRVPLHVIHAELNALGITAKWTMAAEAREYRETLAIEKTLKENPEKGREWLASQERYEATSDPRDEDQAADAA